MRVRIAIVYFSVVCVLGIPENGWATHVIDRSLPQMTVAANAVVQGRVVSIQGRRSATNSKRFVTHVRVQYDRVFMHDRQASAGAVETIVVPGGVVGRYGQFVPGSPRFRLGQEVILLLVRQNHTDLLMPMGLAMGLYVVDRTSTRIPMAISNRAGLIRMRKNTAGHWARSEEPDVVRIPLEDILESLARGVGP